MSSASVMFLIMSVVFFISSELIKALEKLDHFSCISNHNWYRCKLVFIIVLPVLIFLGSVCTMGFFISLL